MKNYMPPIVGFHGCEKEIAEKVISGKNVLKASDNDYDWLGTGIYFWVDSYERAVNWARNNNNIKEPYVIGAFIQPKHCLNLTDYGVNNLLIKNYNSYVDLCKALELNLPRNEISNNGIYLKRHLDCAVINYTNSIKKYTYDTVYGVFEEGKSLYPNSGIKEKTHIQIAVRNQDSIIGYFRPKDK